MFTLKFESDPKGKDCQAISYLTSTPTYSAMRQKDGSVHIYGEPRDGEPLDDGDALIAVVDGMLGGYDRCYAMNANGKTVDVYTPAP